MPCSMGEEGHGTTKSANFRGRIMSTLYEQLGGEGAVDAAVNLFYRKVLADSRIARFFDDIDMDEQIVKQKAFLTMTFG